MAKQWITFFSQTGAEICDITESIGKWPDRIITNKRPEHLRTIDSRIPKDLLMYTQNKPELHEYNWLLQEFDNPIITLHGWLRVMPPEICERFTMYNGHPGLITKYEFLKGKDPQIRAFKEKLPVMGCVIHKVTAGVDEGKVLKEIRFNAFNITEEEMWKVFKDRSLYLWCQFLEQLDIPPGKKLHQKLKA